MIDLPITEAENTHRLLAHLEAHLPAVVGRNVVLVDGDRTLTPGDTSRAFLDVAGIDWQPIKERFQREGYTFGAFRSHASVHLAIQTEVFDAAARQVAEQTVLHPGAGDFLRNAANRAVLFIVTSGIPAIWREVLRRESVFGATVIGGIDSDLPLVFGRAEKGQACRTILAKARKVIAVGDSEVDADMMRLADMAVVVMNHRRNADLLPFLVDHPAVLQIAPNGDPHPSIPTTTFSSLADTLLD